MNSGREKKVKIDRKVLYEICDTILSHDGYSDEGYDCIYTGRWDVDFLQKVNNIRNNS